MAQAGESVTLVFADQVDCSRGDMVAAADDPPDVASRLLATLVSAAKSGELLTVRPLDAAGGQLLLAFDRPAALSAYPGEAMLTIDDEGDEAALLGTGFAMRLVRNLAKELGGALLFERDRLVLRLPAREDVPVGQAHRG